MSAYPERLIPIIMPRGEYHRRHFSSATFDKNSSGGRRGLRFCALAPMDFRSQELGWEDTAHNSGRSKNLELLFSSSKFPRNLLRRV
jgi:hypothetical protein